MSRAQSTYFFRISPTFLHKILIRRKSCCYMLKRAVRESTKNKSRLKSSALLHVYTLNRVKQEKNKKLGIRLKLPANLGIGFTELFLGENLLFERSARLRIV